MLWPSGRREKYVNFNIFDSCLADEFKSIFAMHTGHDLAMYNVYIFYNDSMSV